MSLSLYDVTVPAFIHSLTALKALLDKGRAFADEQGIPHEELLGARLFEDMHPLVYQVQRASDSAKFTVARVGEVEAPAMADDEASFADLGARIDRTIDFLKTVSPDCMDGRDDATVELKTPTRTLAFTGLSYVLHFALPNFYFHVTTAYDILRHKGVPVGKRDFIAWS